MQIYFYSIEVSEQTLKFGNVVINKKEFHASKQANLSIEIKALNILLTTKMITLLDRYVLFCLKIVDT